LDIYTGKVRFEIMDIRILPARISNPTPLLCNVRVTFPHHLPNYKVRLYFLTQRLGILLTICPPRSLEGEALPLLALLIELIKKGKASLVGIGIDKSLPF
jgi:hypothetical protein